MAISDLFDEEVRCREGLALKLSLLRVCHIPSRISASGDANAFQNVKPCPRDELQRLYGRSKLWRPPTTCRARMEAHECGQDIRNSYLCDSSRVDKFPSRFGANRPVGRAVASDSGGESPSLLSVTTADQSQDAGCCDVGFGQSCCCPRWTASADFIILERVGSVNQTLVETVSHGVPSPKTSYRRPGTEVLYANDLHQGFSGGPKFGLIHHGEDGGDLEVLVFSDRRLE